MSEITADTAAPLEQLVRDNPIKVSRSLVWAIMILLSTVMVWTYFVTLPEYAVSLGSVVPQSQVRVIQHLEGGIIKEFYVRDGDTVQKDDPLIQINLASSGINREELLGALDGFILIRARLEAEATGSKIVLPAAEAERQPALAAAEINNLEFRRSELKSSKIVLERQVEQAKLAIKEFQVALKTKNKDLGLARDKLAISASLLEEQLVTLVSHKDALALVGQLEGDVDSIKVSIPKARSALAETNERLRELDLKFRREAQGQRAEVETKIASTTERLVKASEQKLRTEIVSPIDGVIKNMAFNTVGGVVKAGEPIMSVVPTEETLVIEVELAPEDVGYVKVGQPALVKVTSYDFVRYGGLEGKVDFIAPDTDLDPDGNPYFLVKVKTDKAYLGTREGDLPITPGMQASVDIQTGSKSVLEYLIRPVLKIRYEAFHER
jgi:adhesin transport system membrane fusion protein